jgi:hypothetical protein
MREQDFADSSNGLEAGTLELHPFRRVADLAVGLADLPIAGVDDDCRG